MASFRTGQLVTVPSAAIDGFKWLYFSTAAMPSDVMTVALVLGEAYACSSPMGMPMDSFDLTRCKFYRVLVGGKTRILSDDAIFDMPSGKMLDPIPWDDI